MAEPDRRATTARAARLDWHAVCACGQDLDAWSHAHCPRCGHRVGVQDRVAVLLPSA